MFSIFLVNGLYTFLNMLREVTSSYKLTDAFFSEASNFIHICVANYRRGFEVLQLTSFF